MHTKDFQMSACIYIVLENYVALMPVLPGIINNHVTGVLHASLQGFSLGGECRLQSGIRFKLDCQQSVKHLKAQARRLTYSKICHS